MEALTNLFNQTVIDGTSITFISACATLFSAIIFGLIISVTSKITNPITAGIRTSDITKFLFGTTSFVVIIYVTDIIRPNIMAENKVAQAEINVIDVPSITV